VLPPKSGGPISTISGSVRESNVTIAIRRNKLALSVLSVVLLIGCRRECEPPAPLDTGDIVSSNNATAAEQFGVDLCIDATPSMKGFAAPPTSNYRAFLEDLEGSLVSGVRNVSDIRYFKFGETIREVTRAEFRDARVAPFYHEPGIFRDTDIELVFRTAEAAGVRTAQPILATAAQNKNRDAAAPPPQRRLIVVVTDLFQRDQDVNAVVKQIRTRCLSDPQCSVGLMAIPSHFDGTVHDARVPSFPYRSTDDIATFRPFYLLMFGPDDELRRFADVLSSRRYVDLRRLTVIGPKAVAKYSAEVKPGPASDGVTRRAACGYDAAMNLRKNFKEATLNAVITITPDPQAFGFNPSRVAIRAFREANGKQIPADGEVSLTTTGKGSVVEIGARIRPPREKGDYVYTFEVLTGDVHGFVLPKWVADFTSPDPRPDRDPAKTLNLDRFVEQLIASSILEDHHQPKLARFRVLIHKL
jgi:hypothetical protein